ncbi:unnamed protein product [Rotaria magnacalcarata]
MWSMLLFMPSLWVFVSSQLNLYHTTHSHYIDSLDYDCLYYYDIKWGVTEVIPYCIRPTDINSARRNAFPNIYDQKFTFEQLYHLNVTAQQLLSWSASINLAEQYHHYINQVDTSFLSNETFLNCTQSWFGSDCQYSFELNEVISFNDILQMIFEAKWKYINLSYTATNLTCYMHLKCDRGGSALCLDWREICNGRIDCLDGGADEIECLELEVNECHEDEYRCHNGECILKESSELEDIVSYCLDNSDIHEEERCYGLTLISRFECEEHLCRPDDGQFPCGDGQCVEDFEECHNGRHILLIETISAQGTLPNYCWMTMVCLTKISDHVAGISCKEYFASSYSSAHRFTCESLIQFPIIPVLQGHIHFLYRPKDIYNVNIESVLTPDYICYDYHLCKFLQTTFRNRNHTCRHAHEMGFKPNITFDSWKSMIDFIRPYFRGCLTRYKMENDSEPISLYRCKNSSKYISKHRIIDGISDCYLNDDEQEYAISCSIQNKFRFQCFNETMCRSPLISKNVCPFKKRTNLEEITFQEICDRNEQLSPVIIDKRIHTDETDCQHWQCSNIYTRCDKFWSCSDGIDEENCTRPICSHGNLACVSPFNYTLGCLSADRVHDGIIDCLGAADELQYCRTQSQAFGIYHGFRCLNDTKCVGSAYLCDSYAHCLHNDDEAFCGERRRICDKHMVLNRTNLEHALCAFSDLKQTSFFSFETLPSYPSSSKRMINRVAKLLPEQPDTINNSKYKIINSSLAWYCNYGIYVRFRLNGQYSNVTYRCFCPPHFYGDRCQYQNQRVSLTLKLMAFDRREIYIIFIFLIDDDGDRQEINSYDQSTYVSDNTCQAFWNIYLLYSTRPKNNSKNYSVHIDAFSKSSLTYLASWYFKIPFLFLPVNRLVAALSVPIHQSFSCHNCPLLCHNGESMKYVNNKKLFCRCYRGWSGAHCNISISCDDCSADSMCIGSIQNRSICVCPLNKFGLRCLLTYSCPANFCKNEGKCIVIDERMIEQSYRCICSEQFTGDTCEELKTKIMISFHHMPIPSHIVTHILNFYDRFLPPMEIMIPKKLTMFERTVTLYSLLPFQIVFVKIDDRYYLAVLQQSEQSNISTSIDSSQRCSSINEILDPTLIALPQIQRVKYYQLPCRTYSNLKCFFDKSYMCLCTAERHANCFKFNHNFNLTCQHNIHCQNGGKCLQDNPACPSYTICVCKDCFFGDRCQFYAKGIGLTLDDILRFELISHLAYSHQPLSVKISSISTIIIFIAGFINSILVFLVFYSKGSREVGCGLYLLVSSITSFFTVSIITVKFWFLVFTQINLPVNRWILRGGCKFLEPILKVFLYMDSWLHACVAIERAITVFQGVNFNKTASKYVARWVISFLPIFIVATILHEILYRDLFDDNEEQRVWCVVYYSHPVRNYNTVISFFHFLGPCCVNILSAVFIVLSATHRQQVVQTHKSYIKHLREQFHEHKQLIVSPMILFILSLPRLIISLISDCVKKSHYPWLYLSGYFLSFIPSIAIFLVFVIPSNLYKQRLKKSLEHFQQRINQYRNFLST